MAIKALSYPFEEEEVRALRAGDLVALSGRVFAARDRVHRYLHDGGECPVDLTDGCIYHCGPIVMKRKGEWVVTSAGPTTSIREEPYMADIIRDHGVRIVIGKGGMGERTRQACQAHGCVYLQAVGGAAAVLGQAITRVDGVFFEDTFGLAEALWLMQADALEATVTIDANGHSLHEDVALASQARLAEQEKALS